jgi:broad specificity phosphatase PhoE
VESVVPTRFLLLRHAESADPSVFHGAESDVELSPRGHRQAELIAAYLRGFEPAVVVSSAMRRALDTARPIAAACRVTVEIEPLLHERRVGSMSGMPTGERDGPWPRTLRRWMAGETGYALPGAESFDNIRNRVLPVWQDVTQRHEGRTVVIVAHGIICRVLQVSLIAGNSVADWQRLGPTPNVAVSELVCEGAGPWRLLRLNELPEGFERGASL